MIQTVRVDGKPKNVNTGEIENYGAEVEASWIIDSSWTLNTNHSFLHMKNPVIASPTYKGFFGVDYNYNKKLLVNLGLQYINGLYTAVGQDETKENFCLLNLAVTYNINKIIALWARGENLLAQKYEINLGYPMPRATFMFGTNFRI